MFTIYASNYAPINPLVPPCDINLIPIGYVGENLARCLVFDLSECVEQFGDGGFVISFMRHGDELPYLVTNTDRLEDNAIWNITDTDTAVDGYGLVQLQYIVDEVVCKSALYRTVTFESNGITGDVPDPYEDLLAQIAAYASQSQAAANTATAAAAAASTAVDNGIKAERSQRLAADASLNEKIDSLQASVGAPLTVTQASAMTDVNKIYVYTGSETGYTFGNWYYYNGAEWVSGGVYNSEGTNIDDSLTMAGFAADAKAAGDRINAAFVTEQTSGTICSFDDGADDVPVKDLVVNITAVQTGTGDPSPTNIRPITAFDAANITVSSKNLLDESTIEYGSYDTTGYPTQNDNAVYRRFSISLKAGTYTFKTDLTDAHIIAYFVNSSRTSVSGDRNTVTFTSAVDFVFKLSFRNTSSAAITELFNCQLEIGSVATDYEPHNGNTYNISFGAASTVYGGTLDVTSGMLTVTWMAENLGNVTSWNYYTGGTYPVFRTTWFANRRIGTNADGVYGLCSCYKFAGNGTLGNLTSSMPDLSFGYQNTASWINFRDDRFTDVDSLRASLNGQYICYELAEPISYQLDPVTIASLIGNNNIWCDTGDITNLEYRADTRLYIEHLTHPDGDMVADANIANGSYFMVNNRLYLATAAIASGASIVPGTNCTETNLASALNAINS